eukprot:jgi/Undpi1/764/HiC_scaffold_10.g04228.m1
MLSVALVGGASALALSPPTAGARLSMRLGGVTTPPQQRGLHMASMPGSGSGSGLEGQQGRNALPTSRRDVLGAVFGVAASSFAFVAAADAKDDPALKGTKADPEFVTCLSECIYYCTKSKEQSRSRQECIPECRQTCAKTKAQGMIGNPRG